MTRSKLILYGKLYASRVLSRLRRKIIGPRVRAVLTEGFNGSILVSADDLFIGRRLCWLGEYNRQQVERLLKLCAGKRVLIVGTHVGTILVPVARVASRVVGIEADPSNFDLLSKNVLLNDLPNVSLFHIAASDQDCKIVFLTGRVNTGGGKVMQNMQRKEFLFDHPATVEVDARPLDSFLSDDFDLVLMDIEGSEYRALRGMPQVLSKIETLVVEILPNSIENLSAITQEQFLSAIPERLCYAYYMHGSHSKVYDRPAFMSLTEEIWREHYYDGCDIAFTHQSPS